MAGVYTPTHHRYTATAAGYFSRDPHRTQTHGVTVVYDSAAAAAAASAVSQYNVYTAAARSTQHHDSVILYVCVRMYLTRPANSSPISHPYLSLSLPTFYYYILSCV